VDATRLELLRPFAVGALLVGDQRQLLVDLLRVGVPDHLLQERGVIEGEVPDRLQQPWRVVEHLTVAVRHGHLEGGVRLARLLVGLQRRTHRASVVDNIRVGRFTHGRWSRRVRRTAEVEAAPSTLARLGSAVDLLAPLGGLQPADRAIVAIARTLPRPTARVHKCPAPCWHGSRCRWSRELRAHTSSIELAGGARNHLGLVGGGFARVPIRAHGRAR
jgi:hypothetical protein